jgi:acetylornithine/N-succinyldiaminopimelate aminotransferase
LARLCETYPGVVNDLRGEGLLIGLHCVVTNTDFVDALRAQKLLTVAAGDNTVRLLPPLNVTQSELEIALRAVEQACAALV